MDYEPFFIDGEHITFECKRIHISEMDEDSNCRKLCEGNGVEYFLEGPKTFLAHGVRYELLGMPINITTGPNDGRKFYKGCVKQFYFDEQGNEVTLEQIKALGPISAWQR